MPGAVNAGSQGIQGAVRRAVLPTSQAGDAAARAAADALSLSAAARGAHDPLAGLVFKAAGDRTGVLGGHLPKQILVDQHAQRWLFKEIPPGQEYRGMTDAVGSEIFQAIGLTTPAVRMFDAVVEGQRLRGTIQPMAQHSGKVLDARKLSAEQTDELTQSHVGRWLISDHDGKAENFLLMKDMHVQPIDLGQMYRFFPGDSLDRKFQPNADKPIYRQMWKAYTTGKIDLDFRKGLEIVERVEALEDRRFVAMLKPYAEARYRQAGALPGLPTSEDFLAAALRRKQNLRTDMLGFYDSLAKERGLSGLAEAMGGAVPETTMRTLGLAPVGRLHPEVAAAWGQSKANANRYKEESLQLLTRKLGSRGAAETEYANLLRQAQRHMTIAANYDPKAMARALQEGRVRTLYDLPRQEQVALKGEAYLARRTGVDRALGLDRSNPHYVSIGGNPKYDRDVARKYGGVQATYRTEALADRTLFSEGNHFHFAGERDPVKSYREHRFTWFDAPHLLINRTLKEEGGRESSHLIEGTVFGGLDPRETIARLQVLKQEAGTDALRRAAAQAGVEVAP